MGGVSENFHGVMNQKPKYILVAGIGKSNFIGQLYLSIHKKYPKKFDIDILGLRLFSNLEKGKYAECFTNQFKIRKSIEIKDLINIFNFKLYLHLFRFIRFGASANYLYSFFKEFVVYATMSKKILKNNYDIIHFHFPTKEKLALFWHIGRNQKYVVSFWGSDLMRVNGVFNYYIQKKVLRDAYKITTHSLELKDQILTKFGRDLRDKIFLTKFPPEEKLYRILDEYSPKIDLIRIRFLQEFNFPLTKNLIVIGHNGFRENNHIQILKQLSNIPLEIKEKCYFILPFSYKNAKDNLYEKECLQELSRSDFSGKILDTFLSWEELALLKLCTKVYIHLPVSDALSGSLTEAMYAGSEVITGKWLPYSPFEDAGLSYYSINDFSELPQIFELAISKNPDQNSALANKEKIRDYFFPDFCAKTWFSVLEN
ncbi:Glycosyltransferase involved in cell wall bisynthesis [Cyclobacterium lianum]|uniref:Glycosyltransferase involved in cell wall bisynthesis n=1 Tax=Cyclobacterium lianum TaxID=388280 RepID=A0A1M7NDP9_9BACT|nr:glycosyltransferase [Cyclobacterium lianum]SHN01785.1 Glycosyltransferase involved in cell wall bisynthesis [Cyclobacterium lianum]